MASDHRPFFNLLGDANLPARTTCVMRSDSRRCQTSECKAGCSAIMDRAPSLKNVRTIDSILVPTTSAPQHIHVLAVTVADVAGQPNHLLPISVDVSDLSGAGAWSATELVRCKRQ